MEEEKEANVDDKTDANILDMLDQKKVSTQNGNEPARRSQPSNETQNVTEQIQQLDQKYSKKKKTMPAANATNQDHEQ